MELFNAQTPKNELLKYNLEMDIFPGDSVVSMKYKGGVIITAVSYSKRISNDVIIGCMVPYYCKDKLGLFNKDPFEDLKNVYIIRCIGELTPKGMILKPMTEQGMYTRYGHDVDYIIDDFESTTCVFYSADVSAHIIRTLEDKISMFGIDMYGLVLRSSDTEPPISIFKTKDIKILALNNPGFLSSEEDRYKFFIPAKYLKSAAELKKMFQKAAAKGFPQYRISSSNNATQAQKNNRLFALSGKKVTVTTKHLKTKLSNLKKKSRKKYGL